MDRRPARRHRELHARVPHVLRQHRAGAEQQAGHRRHLRAAVESAFHRVRREGRMAQRDDEATVAGEGDPAAPEGGAGEVHLCVRVGEGSEGHAGGQHAPEGEFFHEHGS